MSKTKILFISVRADHGGGPKHIGQLVEILHQDFDLYIACPADEPYYSTWKALLGEQRIIVIPHRKFSLASLYSIWNLLRKDGITIIHSHGKGAGIYSRVLKLFSFKCNIVHTFHGIHIYNYNTIQKWLYVHFEKALSILTDKCINVSHSEKKICLELGIIDVDASKVIYNGSSDLGLMKDWQDKTSDSENFIVATISRFDISKNMQLAYEIAKAFKDRKEVSFLWIGDGPDRLELQELAEKEGLNVIFTGFQENVAAFLGSASIYLSTSRWEGLPISLMEASALGLPLVATDVVGNNEVVQHRVNGFLFNASLPEEAVSAIECLHADTAYYEKLSLGARKIFKEKFHIDKMAYAYMSFYSSLNK
jgi:glycosyltransferase involved in cell wall biosynthesis